MASSYPRIVGKCLFCDANIIARSRSMVSGRKYCSRNCGNKGTANKRTGLKRTEETCALMSRIGKERFEKNPIEIAYKLSQARKGRTMPESAKIAIAKYNREERIYSDSMREKLSRAHKGDKNPFWKGGLTVKNYHERVAIMNSFEYKNWRRKIFDRDDYTCQICFRRGVKLNADHIKPFSKYPHLRFSLENGRTLCVECHRRTPTYGINLQYQTT